MALDPSEQLVAIELDMQYCSVYLSLAHRFCIIVLQDVLKKLVNHQHNPQELEDIATVREVDLMSAPQCGQHTTVVIVCSYLFVSIIVFLNWPWDEQKSQLFSPHN